MLFVMVGWNSLRRSRGATSPINRSGINSALDSIVDRSIGWCDNTSLPFQVCGYQTKYAGQNDS